MPAIPMPKPAMTPGMPKPATSPLLAPSGAAVRPATIGLQNNFSPQIPKMAAYRALGQMVAGQKH